MQSPNLLNFPHPPSPMFQSTPGSNITSISGFLTPLNGVAPPTPLLYSAKTVSPFNPSLVLSPAGASDGVNSLSSWQSAKNQSVAAFQDSGLNYFGKNQDSLKFLL